MIVWAASLVVALLVPATLVAPSSTTAPAGHVLLVYLVAAGCILLMLGTTWLVAVRSKLTSVLILGAVPSFVCILYTVLITIAKLEN